MSFTRRPGYKNWQESEPSCHIPALDCSWLDHLWVELQQPGAHPTYNGEIPWARWCIWCGAGSSNEALPEQDAEIDVQEPYDQEDDQ